MRAWKLSILAITLLVILAAGSGGQVGWGQASILVIDNNCGWASRALRDLGISFVERTQSQFSKMSAFDISQFRLVIVGWSGDCGSPNVSGLQANRAVLADAINGRVVLTGQDPDWHMVDDDDSDDRTSARHLFSNMIDWVLEGSGTGLIATADPEGNWDWTPWSADLTGHVFHEGNDNIRIQSSHLIFSGLSSSDLSGWDASSHMYIDRDLPGFQTVATTSAISKRITLVRESVGSIVFQDDFETCDFSRYPWRTNAGIDTSEARGSCAVEFDPGEYLELTFTVPDGSISFYRNVDSGEGTLTFRIDGREVRRWSGESGEGENVFVPETFPVSAGTHTFRWEGADDCCPEIDDVSYQGFAGPETAVRIKGFGIVSSGNPWDCRAPDTRLGSAASYVNHTVTLQAIPSPNLDIMITLDIFYVDSSGEARDHEIFRIDDRGRGGAEQVTHVLTIEDFPNTDAVFTGVLGGCVGYVDGDPGDGFSFDFRVLAPGGGLSEGFETSSVLPGGWRTGGDASWLVQSSVVHSGSRAAQSGDIGDGERTWLEVTRSVSGSISFWLKVSSEGGFDFLRFFIDGTEMNSWSGDTGWQFASFSVSPGTHTFRWEYTKDGSVSSGSDAAWIDDVNFR